MQWSLLRLWTASVTVNGEGGIHAIVGVVFVDCIGYRRKKFPVLLPLRLLSFVKVS